MGLTVLLHVLSAVIWVRGMFFAYMAMRPVSVSPSKSVSLNAEVI